MNAKSSKLYAGMDVHKESIASRWLRWVQKSAITRDAHSAPGFWPFLDLHASIAFNSAGDRERARTLVRAISDYARSDTCPARVARAVALPAVRAIEAFTTGAYAEAGMRRADTADAEAGRCDGRQNVY